ncbi:MAG: hypothetical protein WKG00_38445, partial [Polyangiaceae bacterium]
MVTKNQLSPTRTAPVGLPKSVLDRARCRVAHALHRLPVDHHVQRALRAAEAGGHQRGAPARIEEGLPRRVAAHVLGGLRLVVPGRGRGGALAHAADGVEAVVEAQLPAPDACPVGAAPPPDVGAHGHRVTAAAVV